MSPATRIDPAPRLIAPAETTSPRTSRVAEPLIVIALPPTPPQPAWFSAANVGACRRLLTPPEAVALSLGVEPFVRIPANWRLRGRLADIVNKEPAAPSADIAWVSTVPSEYVQ